jgi:hypothetical protein
MAFVFDPHPLGCPVGLAVTPAEMTDVVSRIYLQLRDLVQLSVHVITPRRGDPYPILNLYADADDAAPRMVWFPGWETNRIVPKRRIDYSRQTTLIQRIHEAGVEGESLEQYQGVQGGRTAAPLQLCLGYPETALSTVLVDLDAKLGDLVRMTATTLTGSGAEGGRITAVRLYAPVDEDGPRVVLWPGWFGSHENPGTRITDEKRAGLWDRLRLGKEKETPLELIQR